jgi:hypothetical protein
VDEVTYSDYWYHDDVKKDGGWTLELINPEAPAACADSVNWTASNDAAGGTPDSRTAYIQQPPMHPSNTSQHPGS